MGGSRKEICEVLWKGVRRKEGKGCAHVEASL